MVDRDAYADLTTLVPVALLLDLRLQCCVRVAEHGIEEVSQVLQNPASGLRDRIVRDVGLFTVGLLRVSQTAHGERLDLCGTGNFGLVRRGALHSDRCHVWEKLCRGAAPASVGLTLRENLDHKYLIDRAAIVATGPPKPSPME